MNDFKPHGVFAGFILLLLLSLFSCNTSKDMQYPRFTLLDAELTGINFVNQLNYTEEFNTYTYRNFYNGAGVGMGDFNNDGLQDIYFCGNMTNNRLYINKGNFVFDDVTEQAGLACENVWSTGVSIADINADGLPDIFVCKSGKPDSPGRHNELFINNGDLTFTEMAKEYGLADVGLANHASFFDYDNDGDLDCYLLSNSFQSVTEFDIQPDQRQIRDSLGGNKLYRNDNGYFTDVSLEAGIFGSKIGFGLGISVGDLNRDNWQDIYISNDFFERDYLYINNKNGTFTEVLEDQLSEISLGAMGADVADINNDAWPEIFATEMTAEDNARLKTKVLFEDWERYQMKVSRGYHHQFARNVLQLNNRNGTFSEIGRFSSVSRTDWSWGALIMDLDNDGFKDIFVANGIFKDLLDLDFLDLYSDPSVMRTMMRTGEQAILKMIDAIPSVPIPNYAFQNNGNLTFTNRSEPWGLGTPSFSNGAAYVDLDNDGDLDLVVSNVNMAPFVYRNESEKNDSADFLVLSLKGTAGNTGAVGAAATLFYHNTLSFQELIPQRGFMSSMDPRLHFGLGKCSKVDSIVVNWPDGKVSRLFNINTNQFLVLDHKDARETIKLEELEIKSTDVLFSLVNPPAGLEFKHRENDYNDFERDGLLFNMISNEGPHMAVSDVNGDGLDDLYICGARGTPGSLLIQDTKGKFRKTNESLFASDSLSEDTDCAFFDADNDGDTDLYVTSGGNELPNSSSALRDRLYLNDGRGNFSKSNQMLPVSRYESSSCVEPADFDHDGDMDLFVGIRLQPFNYGLPVNGYLLENDGKGKFRNISDKNAPGLKNLGLITDMAWADIDSDNDLDMLIIGEWMPLKVFINNNGKFTDESEKYGLEDTDGWWHTVTAKDMNGDGKTDFILGNQGLNSYFKPSPSQPVVMFVNDFDLNGSVEQLVCTYENDRLYPIVRKDELVRQIPSLSSKYMKYSDYKDQTIQDLFTPEVLARSVQLKVKMTESCILINTGNGPFKIIALPAEAQFFPVYSIFAEDFDNDGICDLIIGGNQYRAKPQTGIYAAGYGLLLKSTKDEKWLPVSAKQSGILIKGEIRDMDLLLINKSRLLVFARNNNTLQFYNY